MLEEVEWHSREPWVKKWSNSDETHKEFKNFFGGAIRLEDKNNKRYSKVAG